jgi:hypothetical protein
MLLFIVLHKTTGAPWRSAFVAAMFSIHPLRIESVAWATERKDVLGAFFWMATLWTYIGYVRRPGLLKYALIIFSFSLGLMAKPMLVTLPFVLLLMDFWPLGRVGIREYPTIEPESGKRKASPAWLVIEKLPLFALAAASSIVTYWVVRIRGGINAEAIPFPWRLANGVVSYLEYMGKLVWPSELAILYPHPSDSLPLLQAAASFAVLAAISILVLVHAKRYPYLIVGWLWFLGTLVPIIGFIQVGAQSMADRFTYVPHVGLVIALTWITSEFTSSWRRRKAVLSIVSGLIIFLFSTSTAYQLGYWKDSIALFSRAVQVTSNNSLAHLFLGVALASEGRLDQATIHFSESIKIKPRLSALSNMARTLVRQGKLEEAAAMYSRALQVAPYDATIHNNLANVLVELGKVKQGVLHYKEALLIQPELAEASHNLERALRKLAKNEAGWQDE